MNLDSFYNHCNYFKPDSNNPIIYFLHKIGVGANNLVTSQYGVRDGLWVNVQRDGTPVNVDLLNRTVGSGSMVIRQTKHAQWISATNWSFTMKMNDGGFIEENEEFPFTLPESGYQSVLTFNFQKGQTNWTTELKKDFYVKFGNPPLYGQIEVETSCVQNTVTLTYLINPDGSRNLEPKQNYFPSSSVWRH
jgi:hypothetical protein